ncbi:hypothetical protein HOH45_06515 [bacterium]|mgnify:FL=1|jgi:hypothetical protein|nr:hypothetical protein [bacterium]
MSEQGFLNLNSLKSLNVAKHSLSKISKDKLPEEDDQFAKILANVIDKELTIAEQSDLQVQHHKPLDVQKQSKNYEIDPLSGMVKSLNDFKAFS